MIDFKDYVNYPLQLFQNGGLTTFNIGNEAPTNGLAAQMAANIPIAPIVQNPLDISSSFRDRTLDLQEDAFSYRKTKDIMDFTSKLYDKVGKGVATSTSDATGLYLPIYGEDEAQFNKTYGEMQSNMTNAMFSGDTQTAIKLFNELNQLPKSRNFRVAGENSAILNSITNFKPELKTGQAFDTQGALSFSKKAEDWLRQDDNKYRSLTDFMRQEGVSNLEDFVYNENEAVKEIDTYIKADADFEYRQLMAESIGGNPALAELRERLVDGGDISSQDLAKFLMSNGTTKQHIANTIGGGEKGLTKYIDQRRQNTTINEKQLNKVIDVATELNPQLYEVEVDGKKYEVKLDALGRIVEDRVETIGNIEQAEAEFGFDTQLATQKNEAAVQLEKEKTTRKATKQTYEANRTSSSKNTYETINNSGLVDNELDADSMSKDMLNAYEDGKEMDVLFAEIVETYEIEGDEAKKELADTIEKTYRNYKSNGLEAGINKIEPIKESTSTDFIKPSGNEILDMGELFHKIESPNKGFGATNDETTALGNWQFLYTDFRDQISAAIDDRGLEWEGIQLTDEEEDYFRTNNIWGSAKRRKANNLTEDDKKKAAAFLRSPEAQKDLWGSNYEEYKSNLPQLRELDTEGKYSDAQLMYMLHHQGTLKSASEFIKTGKSPITAAGRNITNELNRALSKMAKVSSNSGFTGFIDEDGMSRGSSDTVTPQTEFDPSIYYDIDSKTTLTEPTSVDQGSTTEPVDSTSEVAQSQPQSRLEKVLTDTQEERTQVFGELATLDTEIGKYEEVINTLPDTDEFGRDNQEKIDLLESRRQAINKKLSKERAFERLNKKNDGAFTEMNDREEVANLIIEKMGQVGPGKEHEFDEVRRVSGNAKVRGNLKVRMSSDGETYVITAGQGRVTNPKTGGEVFNKTDLVDYLRVADDIKLKK
jgi:hypothetical protein